MAKRIERCPEYQANRRVSDFACDLAAGHTEAHRDPRTGMRWRPRRHRPSRRNGYHNPKLIRKAKQKAKAKAG